MQLPLTAPHRLHVGAHLRVKGLVLNHAVLPSQQLVASGLAAPAPLAFNLSVSGNSSLLLDGVTVVTGCSNLDQYRLWVGSLANSDRADVQVCRQTGRRRVPAAESRSGGGRAGLIGRPASG